MKDRLWSIGIGAFIVVTVAAIPIGAILAFWTGNGYWFLLCTLIVLYLS